MKRSPMKRGRSLARGKSIKRSNPRRRKEQHARNFGEEAALVRSLPCLVCGGLAAAGDPAHVTSRGAGGGRFDLVPLCRTHHDEQHRVGVESFAGAYQLDLRAEADRVALLHEPPLGVRGLAQRWASTSARNLVPMFAYEREALLGWVRRAIAEAVRQARELLPEHDERALATGWLMDALQLRAESAAALCELAGWPS